MIRYIVVNTGNEYWKHNQTWDGFVIEELIWTT